MVESPLMEDRMRRPKRVRRYQGFGISMPPDVYAQLLALATDEKGYELPGGVSAVVRSIVEPYLARRARRQAKQAVAA